MGAEQHQAGARRALVANRRTGDLETMNIPSGLPWQPPPDWMIVCREPEDVIDPAAVSDGEYLPGQGRLVRPKIVLQHMHDHGQPQPECPQFPFPLSGDNVDAFDVLPPAEWQADDLARIHENACWGLQTDTLIWTIEQKLDGRGRDNPERTIITIEPGRHAERYSLARRLQHQLQVTYVGLPNPVALAWLAAQSNRAAFRAIVGAHDPGENLYITPYISRIPRARETR